MIWASWFTAPFGLTEPLFVPSYWNPPSLFNLAERTGFDLESLIFCFAIGGVGAVLVNLVTRRAVEPVRPTERHHPRHRLHRLVLSAPFILFALLVPFDWNPIYPGVIAMVVGAGLSAWCRPDLGRSIVLGGIIFLLFYSVFLAGLQLTAPLGYIEEVWNLEVLSGVVVGFIPLEELLFAAGFGSYWAGVYEHFTWRRPESIRAARPTSEPT